MNIKGLKRGIYTASSPYNVSTPVIAGVAGVELHVYGVSNQAATINTITDSSNVPIMYCPATTTVMLAHPIVIGAGKAINVSADDVIVYYVEVSVSSQAAV